MKKIELLSPAGNMESLKAAVSAGCNAVYLGLTSFSARAFAGNFSHEELIEAVHYCHFYHVKVYVTMNTMLTETEFDNAKKDVDFLYRSHVDALLVQDLGLFSWTRKHYPEFDLHCSTQMHIHNASGVQFMMNQGASRIVLARETPIEVIRECCALNAEIEVFAYGALCISYSGECLMSSAVKNRSGNRGMCAQCCRLRYTAMDSDRKPIKEDGRYLLSPSDLNLIDRIPELISAGVTSLKIEGRMKRPEYVWLITHIMKEAIDAYYDHRKYRLASDDEKSLMLMFNRGFTEGHAFHAEVSERMNHIRPNHMGVPIGKVLAYKDNRVLVSLNQRLNQNDGLRILNEPFDIGLTAVKIELNSLLVNHADKNTDVWLQCNGKDHPKPGMILLKTSDSQLLDYIDRKIAEGPARIPVHIEYTAEIGRCMQLKAADDDGHTAICCSEQAVQKAKNAPLSSERIEQALKKSGDTFFEVVSVNGKADDIFFPMQALNCLRRDTLNALSNLRSIEESRAEPVFVSDELHIEDIPLPNAIISTDTESFEKEGDWYICHHDTGSYRLLSTLNESQNNAGHITKSVLSQIGDLNGTFESCIAGMSFNCANSESVAFLLRIKGICGVIISSELNDMQVQMLLESFFNKHGFYPPIYRLVYGRRDLMLIKNGFSTVQNKISLIEDEEGNTFPITVQKGITTVIEPKPLKENELEHVRNYIILTNESAESIKAIRKELNHEEFS